MHIGDCVVWYVVGRYDSEEVGLGVEDEFDSENYSSVGKDVKDKFSVWFVGSAGVLGLVYMSVVE